MGRPWGPRYLWAVLLTPPLLLLAVAGAVSTWPQQVVSLADRTLGLLSREPATTRRRPPPVMQPPGPPPAPSAMIRGTIRKPDGSPFEGLYSIGVGSGRAHRFGFRGRVSGGKVVSNPARSGPEFAVQAEDELNWVIVDAEDYAAAVAGPIRAEDLRPGAAPVDLVLHEGFPHRVRVIDAEGSPIALAAVRANLTLSPATDRPTGSQSGLEPGADSVPGPLGTTIATDKEGWAVFPHVSEIDYEFDVTVHAGMLPDDTIFARPQSGVDTVIKLRRSSTKGIVVDWAGRPVADAVLMIVSELDEQNGHESSHTSERIIIAKSDAEGRFRLPALHRESTYLISAEGADGSLGYAPGVRATDRELEIQLLRRRIVRGVVVPGRHVAVTCQFTVPTGFDSARAPGGRDVNKEWSKTTVTDAEGRFEVPVWDPSQFELRIGGRPKEFPWPPPAEPLRFDIADDSAPRERTVQLHVEDEGERRPVDGTMTVYLANGPPERALQAVPRLVEIRNGDGAFTCLRDESFRYDVNAIPGYWTAPGVIPSSLGDIPRSVNVRVLPARVIRGRVVEDDGSPVGAGVKIEVLGTGRGDAQNFGRRRDYEARVNAPLSELPGSSQSPMNIYGGLGAEVEPSRMPHAGASWSSVASLLPHDTTTTTDIEGRFTIPSWPVNFPYRIAAIRGRSVRTSAPIQTAVGIASDEVVIVTPRTTTAEVRLLDPDGRPIPNAPLVVTLNREHRACNWPAGTTDADGRVVIDGLGDGESGYNVVFAFSKDYQHLVARLRPGGPLLELKAERGSVIEGRIVEAVTGWPIPKVRIYATSKTPLMNYYAEAPSDEDGRFRISTLPGAGTYEIRDSLFLSLQRQSTPWPVAEAGSGRPVEIRAFNMRDADPRPRPPAHP